jgi:hypothetical protein
MMVISARPACDVAIQRSVSSKPSLLCQGVRVDTIQWVGPVCPVKGLGEDLAITLNLWSRGFRDFQTQCTSFRLSAKESRLESVAAHPSTFPVKQPIDPFPIRSTYSPFLHVCIRARPIT